MQFPLGLVLESEYTLVLLHFWSKGCNTCHV
jgi:hypothetical protein